MTPILLQAGVMMTGKDTKKPPQPAQFDRSKLQAPTLNGSGLAGFLLLSAAYLVVRLRDLDMVMVPVVIPAFGFWHRLGAWL